MPTTPNSCNRRSCCCPTRPAPRVTPAATSCLASACRWTPSPPSPKLLPLRKVHSRLAVPLLTLRHPRRVLQPVVAHAAGQRAAGGRLRDAAQLRHVGRQQRGGVAGHHVRPLRAGHSRQAACNSGKG